MDYKTSTASGGLGIIYVPLRKLERIKRSLPQKDSVTERIILDDREIVLTAKPGRLSAYSRIYSENLHIIYCSKEIMPGLNLEEALSNARGSITSGLTSLEKDSREREFEEEFKKYVRKAYLNLALKRLRTEREEKAIFETAEKSVEDEIDYNADAEKEIGNNAEQLGILLQFPDIEPGIKRAYIEQSRAA
jgi:hypothetical protein